MKRTSKVPSSFVSKVPVRRAVFRRLRKVHQRQIIYKDVHPGVDVRHVAMNEEVKEDIILNEKNMDNEKFTYRIHTKLDVQLDEEGNLLFKDLQNDEVKYTMPAPVMSDSSFDEFSGLSKESRDIHYNNDVLKNPAVKDKLTKKKIKNMKPGNRISPTVVINVYLIKLEFIWI